MIVNCTCQGIEYQLHLIHRNFNPADFVDQPENVTVSQGHSANLTMSTQGCEFVSGTKTFIDCGISSAVEKSELSITYGDRKGQLIIMLTLSNVTEPVKVQFEAFRDSSFAPEDILSETAFILIQGYCSYSVVRNLFN